MPVQTAVDVLYILIKRTEPPDVISLQRLDFDHIRTMIAHETAAKLPELATEIQHPDTL
jgi:hypothetical protein